MYLTLPWRLRVLGVVTSVTVKIGPEQYVGAGYADRGILRVEEVGVIAPVADGVLVLDSRIGVGEGAALLLEDGVDTLVWHDHVETREQVVVCQCSDTLGRGETGSEAGVE